MTDFFSSLLNDLKKDQEEYEGQFEVLEESDTSVCVWDDLSDGPDRCYIITDPGIIDAKFLKEKIIVSPGARPYNLDMDTIADYLYKNVSPEHFMTLQNIIFITGSEEDWEFLHDIEEYEQACETNDIPDNPLFGIMWYCDSAVLINPESIQNAIEKAIMKEADGYIPDDEHYIYPWEEESEFARQVMLTLIHEIRHLAQENPYFPDEQEFGIYPEEDAEDFAREIVESHPIFDILVRQQEIERD